MYVICYCNSLVNVICGGHCQSTVWLGKGVYIDNFAVVSALCTVELVGSIEVTGNTATFAFRGVGSGITGYICKLNGNILPDCK